MVIYFAVLQVAGMMRAVPQTATTAIRLPAFISWLGEDATGFPHTRPLQACPSRVGKAGGKTSRAL